MGMLPPMMANKKEKKMDYGMETWITQWCLGCSLQGEMKVLKFHDN